MRERVDVGAAAARAEEADDLSKLLTRSTSNEAELKAENKVLARQVRAPLSQRDRRAPGTPGAVG